MHVDVVVAARGCCRHRAGIQLVACCGAWRRFSVIWLPRRLRWRSASTAIATRDVGGQCVADAGHRVVAAGAGSCAASSVNSSSRCDRSPGVGAAHVHAVPSVFDAYSAEPAAVSVDRVLSAAGQPLAALPTVDYIGHAALRAYISSGRNRCPARNNAADIRVSAQS